MLTRGKPFDPEGPKHSNGLLTGQGLGVCVQESRRDKEGAANWAPTQSKSPGNLESKAENCLEVQGCRKGKAQLELEPFQGRLWSKPPWWPCNGFMRGRMVGNISMDLPKTNCAQLFPWPSEGTWLGLCLRGEKQIWFAVPLTRPLVLSPLEFLWLK